MTNSAPQPAAIWQKPGREELGRHDAVGIAAVAEALRGRDWSRIAGLTRAGVTPTQLAGGDDLGEGLAVDRDAVALRSARVRSSISPGRSTAPPGSIGGDALVQAMRRSRSVGEEIGAAEGRRVEGERQHVVDAAVPAVGDCGLLAKPPLSEPASTSQKKDRPEPLWPPKGKIAPGGSA